MVCYEHDFVLDNAIMYCEYYSEDPNMVEVSRRVEKMVKLVKLHKMSLILSQTTQLSVINTMLS